MRLPGNQLPPSRSNLDSYFRGQGLEVEPDVSGILVSNDTGYSTIRPIIKEMAPITEGQAGIFVGSGGMFSVMPDLKLAYPILLDIDPNVIDFNKMLANLISTSDTPQEVLNQVREGNIDKEARVYGYDHWTNPDRFQQVKAALENSPPTFVNADITNPRLAGILHRIAGDTDTQIAYANLTNVHRWLNRSLRPNKFIKYWPVKEDALVVYSDFFDTVGFLEMAIATRDKYPTAASTGERVDRIYSNLAKRAISASQ